MLLVVVILNLDHQLPLVLMRDIVELVLVVVEVIHQQDLVVLVLLEQLLLDIKFHLLMQLQKQVVVQ